MPRPTSPAISAGCAAGNSTDTSASAAGSPNSGSDVLIHGCFGRLGRGDRFAPAGRGAVFLFLLAASLLGLLLDQALPVGNGDLIVVRMDFAEGEEAVPVAAILDERGLQAWLYPHHLGEVDVPLELTLGRRLDIEIL